MIPYARQAISQADIDAVVAVLRSDWLTQGPMIERFECGVADYCGAAYAVAVNSATSALHLACLALGLGLDDWLWTSPNTFVASANCALYCGAQVDFVDIDPHSYNLSTVALAAKLEWAAARGVLPKIVIPVHFAGQPCAMQEIRALAEQYGFAVIEDASHALGATYHDEPVGNCQYSDITVFSFHAVKMITTGEGGMALTNRPEVAERLRLLRSHGITRDPVKMRREPDGPWYYEQTVLGWNYRMTDFQAALGISQLEQLDVFLARRRELVDRYDGHLADLPLVRPCRDPQTQSAWHLYVVLIESHSPNRRQVFDRLRQQGIGVNVHYIPVYTQPYYRSLGFKPSDYPEAAQYYREAISLPLFAGLTNADQDQVVASLREILQ